MLNFFGVDFNRFTPEAKRQVEADIAADFSKAYEGIVQLPMKARFGVYVAYKYYLFLLLSLVIYYVFNIKKFYFCHFGGLNRLS